MNWGVWVEDDTAHRDRQSSKERYTHDLSRMARTCKHIAAVVCPLEQRAGCIDVDPSANSDALALLLKALTLLEKALSVSEDATTSQLQEEYAQTLHLAGACHARFGSDPPAGRPHGLTCCELHCSSSWIEAALWSSALTRLTMYSGVWTRSLQS